MRIIDKNTDFYDYYQNIYKDDTFTFDRRDSFLLTKEMLCDCFSIHSSWYFKKEKEYKNYLLLQICHNYWLFKVIFTEIDYINGFEKIKNYDIELITKWKNWNKPRKLCDLNIIDFYFYKYTNNINNLVKSINTNDYKIIKDINKYTIYNGNKEFIKTIPLLKACGIADCIDAHEVYLAFEEYFSLEKTASERREPLNTTDIDRIERHGFDKKTSFRGK